MPMVSDRSTHDDGNGHMLPKIPDEISAEWLTYVLQAAGVLDGAGVRAVRTTSLGSGIGLTGKIARLELEYDRTTHEYPRSLIAKLPPVSDQHGAIGHLLGLYERERRFYLELGDRTAIRTPRCYYSGHDERSGASLLLLEDFSFAQVGDQLTGWTPREATIALRHLAKLHAEWWQHPALDDLHWLPGWDTSGVMDLVETAYQQMWPDFVENYRSNLHDRVLAAGERLASDLRSIAHGFARQPHTLTHGDFRADNLFFGEGTHDPFFGVIDWQLSCRGRGVFDVAYLMSQSGSPELRQLLEMDLLKAYYELLMKDKDRSQYDFDDCFEDYRRGVLYGLVYPVVSSGFVNVRHTRAKRLIETITERVSAAIVYLDAADLLLS